MSVCLQINSSPLQCVVYFRRMEIDLDKVIGEIGKNVYDCLCHDRRNKKKLWEEESVPTKDSQ